MHAMGIKTQKKHASLFSTFMPQKNINKYPSIFPGSYIFVQEASVEENHYGKIYLLTRGGHAWLTSLINHKNNRDLQDVSWLKTAGEILFGAGGEILAWSFKTGTYYESLDLEDNSPQIKKHIIATNLPEERYFSAKEWENPILSENNKKLFFTEEGYYRKIDPKEAPNIRDLVGPSSNSHKNAEKTEVLFNQLIENMIKHQEKQGSTLTSCRSAIFHRDKIHKNNKTSSFTPSAKLRECSPTIPQNVIATQTDVHDSTQEKDKSQSDSQATGLKFGFNICTFQ